MTKLRVKKVEDSDDRSLPVFAEIDAWMERIRARAFDIFSSRDSDEGCALEDWLAAEKDLCWSAAELAEHNEDFLLKVALAGFDANEITVTASPWEIIVKAAHTSTKETREKEPKIHWSEFRSSDAYRCVQLPQQIAVDAVTAEFDKGLLTITAPKDQAGAQVEKRIQISTAA